MEPFIGIRIKFPRVVGAFATTAWTTRTLSRSIEARKTNVASSRSDLVSGLPPSESALPCRAENDSSVGVRERTFEGFKSSGSISYTSSTCHPASIAALSSKSPRFLATEKDCAFDRTWRTTLLGESRSASNFGKNPPSTARQFFQHSFREIFPRVQARV